MHCVDMWVHDSFQIETVFVSETKDHIYLSGEYGDRGLFKLRFTMFFINSVTEVMYDVNLGVQSVAAIVKSAFSVTNMTLLLHLFSFNLIF